MATQPIVLFDTTLRDGEQAPGFSLGPAAKLLIAQALDRLGVDVIEAGFPVASASDAEAVETIAREVRRPAIAALARCEPGDIDRAVEALRPAARPRVHTFIATSDLHLSRKLRITREACLDAAVASVARARRFVADVEFSAEDATRSDPDFLCRVIEAVIDAGCATVNLPDTVGYSTPIEIREFFAQTIARVPNAHRAVFSAHCHDDLGLAVANSLSALHGGVRQIECTINGIGERAGNASLEELVMALRVRPDRLPFTTAIRPVELLECSRLVSALTGEPVQANKAIVGRNAFAHEAGIHQDGVLKDRRTYEIMRPEDVGWPAHTLVLGKHSGRHAVQRRAEALGFTLTRRDVDRVYRGVIELADRQRAIEDEDLRGIVRRVLATPEGDAIPRGHVVEAGYGHGV